MIDVSDVVIEVLDARDPLGCRCRDVESAILESSPNKKIILLLNKIGLFQSKFELSQKKFFFSFRFSS